MRIRKLFLAFLFGLFLVSDIQAIMLTKDKENTSQTQELVRPFEKAGLLHPDNIYKEEPPTSEYAPEEIIVKFSPETKEAIRQMFTSGFTKGLPNKDKFEKPIEFNANLISSRINNIDITLLKDINTKYSSKIEPVCIEPVFKGLHRQLYTQGKDFYKLEIDKLLKNKKARTLTNVQDKVKTFPDLSSIYLVRIQGDVQEAVRDYNQLKDKGIIEYAEPNYKVKVMMYPNDPYYHSQGSWGQSYDDLWGLKKIQCEQAWNISQGKNVVVAVIDTGIDYNHEDIAANIWTNSGETPNNGIDDDNNGYIDDIRGWDFAYDNNDVMDRYGHGTHCAGTIAAVGNNSKGVIGVAPQAKVMAVKGLGDSGGGYDSDLADCIRYAVDNGADVINNSWGPSTQISSNNILEDIVRYAYYKGVVVVFAAGNAGDNVKFYSSQNMKNPKPIVVASVDHADQRSDFSNYGSLIDVAAPGGESGYLCADFSMPSILSLRAQNTDIYGASYSGKMIVGDVYYRARGTSMAAPHVSGAAALVLSYRTNFTTDDPVDEMRQLLRASANDEVGGAGFDAFTGAGRLDTAKALTIQSVPKIQISSPVSGLTFNPLQTESINITGMAYGAGFQQYQLFYGEGNAPSEWIPITQPVNMPVALPDTILGTWIISKLPVNTYLIKLVVDTSEGFHFQDVIQLSIDTPPKKISTNIKNDNPDIFGNRIVWESKYDGEIHLYDLSTNIENTITSDTYFDQSPRIYGDRIVWMKSIEGSYSIYLYDIGTGITERITNDSQKQYYPDIWEDWIVWMNVSDGMVYYYNILSKEQYVLPYSGDSPAISDNRITWVGGGNIYFYDLITKECGPLPLHPSTKRRPAILGNKLVWEDKFSNSNDWNIYLYDFATKTETQITTNPSTQFAPAIYGDWVVWIDYRAGISMSGDIYLYDLRTKTERPILVDPYPQGDMIMSSEVAIYGNRIVWEGSNKPYSYASDWNIYLYDPPSLDSIPPTIPSVNDDGQYTSSTTTLSASWQPSSDPESGIAEYKYKITQDTPEGIVIRDWTSVGLDTSIEAKDLVLNEGKTYYFGVKARNGAGFWSEVGYSDGITVAANPKSPPVFTPPQEGFNITEGKSFSIDLSPYAKSSDGDKIEFLLNTPVHTGEGQDPYQIAVTLQGLLTGNIPYDNTHDSYKMPIDTILVREVDKPDNYTENTVNLNIQDVNQAPVINNSLGNVVVKLGETFEFTIQAQDPEADILTYSASPIPDNATFDTQTGKLTWTPTQDQLRKVYRPVFKVEDTYKASAESRGGTLGAEPAVKLPDLMFTSQSVGPLPIKENGILNVTIGVYNQGWTSVEDIFAIKIDLYEKDILITTRTIYSNEPYKIKDSLGSKLWTIDLNAYELGLKPNTAYLLKFKVDSEDVIKEDNENNNTSQMDFTATFVVDPKSPPVFTPPQEGFNITEGKSFSIDLSPYAKSSDGDKIEFLLNTPEHTGEGQDPYQIAVTLQGLLTGNIPYDNTHDSYKMPIDTILVREVDKPDNYTENTVNLNIQDVNQAPVISSIGYKSIDGGDTLEFTVSAKDPDGDNLRDLKAINLPKGAEFKILPRIAKYSNPNIQGVFTWTPDYNQSGEYKVTFTVSDGALIGEEAINITVNNVNRPLEVTTNIATGIQTTQATLNGALGKLGNDSSAEVWFEYGTDANYGNSTPLQTKTAIGDFNAPITGLSSNNTYHFRAVARNNDGISYGANMSFTTPISIPATPTNLTATASDSTQIDLNWQDNSKNETGFKIERSLNPNAVSKNWSQIATVSKDVTTYSNLNLNANTTYYYRVKAYNEKGESGYSNIANAKTPAKAYSISGKVYTVNGRRQLPLEGATVILYLPKALTKTTTGSDGSYQFKNVPSGTYTIIASKKGYPSQLQRIKVNASLMNVNFLSKS